MRSRRCCRTSLRACRGWTTDGCWVAFCGCFARGRRGATFPEHCEPWTVCCNRFNRWRKIGEAAQQAEAPAVIALGPIAALRPPPRPAGDARNPLTGMLPTLPATGWPRSPEASPGSGWPAPCSSPIMASRPGMTAPNFVGTAGLGIFDGRLPTRLSWPRTRGEGRRMARKSGKLKSGQPATGNRQPATGNRRKPGSLTGATGRYGLATTSAFCGA